MKLKAAGSGEWPLGTHWTPGEVRDVPDAEIARAKTARPSWLAPADPPKTKGKGKTTKPAE